MTDIAPQLEVRAADIFSEDELKRLRKKSDLRGAWIIAHAWIIIAGAMALFALFPNPITFLVAVVLIGTRQLGLAVIMHEGAHGHMFKKRSVNDFVSQWFASFPVATDIRPYRPYHLTHHKYTGQEKDPDLALAAPFPITPLSFRRKAWRDLTGKTGFKQRRNQIKAALGVPGSGFKARALNFWDRLGGFVVTNLIMLAVLSALGYWYLYPLLWLLPLLTWHQFVTRVRNIAEHAMVRDPNDPYANARTTHANWFWRLFLAPYWVNYHCEHHLFIWVPCYNLPLAHKLLVEKGYADKMEIKSGYAEVLKLALSADKDGPKGGKRSTAATNALPQNG